MKIDSLFTLCEFDKRVPLVENVRIALAALEGAWIKVYEVKKPQSKKQMQKVQKLILDALNHLDNNLCELSNITVSIAVFGPLGVGKSYVLNQLLNFGLDKPDFTTLLPSGEGDSQTPIPVRIKFDEQVKITVKREATNVSELIKPKLEEEKFSSKKLDDESLKSVREKLKEIFNDKESLVGVKWLELKGPFPVFTKLKSMIAKHPKHPDIQVDVEFVDLPGCGDKTGNPLIPKELDRANIILLFEAGKSGREVTADDIVGVFRRRQVFEYPSRPKFIHLVNDWKDSPLATGSSFEERLRKKKDDLAKSWEPLFEDNLDDEYQNALKRLPRLMGMKCLQKMKEESEVVIFEPQEDVFLNQLGEAVARHVVDVQIKKEVHPVVEKMFTVAKRLRTRTAVLNSAQKKKLTLKEQDGQHQITKRELEAPVLCIPESEENEDEEDELYSAIMTDDSDQMCRVSRISDIQKVNTQLCDYLFCQEAVLQHLSKVLKGALEEYIKCLLEKAEETYRLSLNVSSQGLEDLSELLCQKRVEMFMKKEGKEYVISEIEKVKRKNLLGDKDWKLEWKTGGEEERLHLIPFFLKCLLTGVLCGFPTPTRKARKPSPLLKLQSEMLKDVQELIHCNPYGVTTSTKDLSLIVNKLDLIVTFCREKIREINPHPSLEGVEMDHKLDFPEPKALEEHAYSSFKPFHASQVIDKLSGIILKKKKGDCLRELEKVLKLPKDALRPHPSQEIRDLWQWAKVLFNVLSGENFLGNPLKVTNPMPIELQVERGKPEIEELINHARRRLFVFEQSKVSCNLVQDEAVEPDEIKLVLNSTEGRECILQAKLSSKLQNELEEIQASFKDPKKQLAPIFIPTIRIGPDQCNLGNFYLVENPWSRGTTKASDKDHQKNGDRDRKAEGGLGDLKANIFIVVEPRHVDECKIAMGTRPPPPGSDITLRYVVLPQNGRGIGVARSIIKLLAERLNLYIYWTIDDDIKFLYQFDMNERRWRKCSFGRALLFGQHVFQHCLAKAFNHLDEKSRDIMAEKVVDDKFPIWAKETRRPARKLLIDDGKFEEVLQNPSLLHSPFSDKNVHADCGNDKAKENELRHTEEVFVADCKSRMHEDALLKVAGVSIAHQRGRRSDYVSKLAKMHYRRSEQRYQMVLNNTEALKGYSFVQDDIVLKEDENTVEVGWKRNTPYYGCRGSDKSFAQALAFYGVFGYQIICFDHQEENLRNVFNRVGASWELSQELYKCDEEDTPLSNE